MAKVAFLGLGVMGYPMAGHLKAKGGHEVTVYNRTAAKAEKWVAQHGGRCAATPNAAAEGQDFVMACVGNDDDLRQVTLGPNGAFAAMKRGAVFVDHTTASAGIARELYAQAKQLGFEFIDAPVSGGQAGAENGVLTVMCGGDGEPYGRAEKVIAVYARMCKLLGAAGAGQLTKMVNQICIGGLVEALAEGIHFAKKAGLDVEAVIETISKGAAQSWQMENRYKTMNRGQVRFRLCGRLDAQGPRHLPGRGAPQWRAAAGDGSGRSVLFRGADNGRPALGHVEPARAAGAVAAAKPRERLSNRNRLSVQPLEQHRIRKLTGPEIFINQGS